MEEYIVQYGDTLMIIAEKKLRDKNRWKEIAIINKLQNPSKLFIGQRLKLPNDNLYQNSIPNQISTPFPDLSVNQVPATIIPARGLMYVVFEQLPEVGSKNVIRKVQVLPADFSLMPKNPLANYSLAEHALDGNNLQTQLLSVSEKPYGSPTMGKYSPIGNPEGYKEVLLIDTNKAMAKGSRVYSVPEVIADLRRYAALEPNNAGLQERVNTLIRTIENVEGEGMIKFGVDGSAVSKISSAHTPYIETADEIWAAVEAKRITPAMAEERLASVARAYERARIVGKFGRVLTVVGVVFTAADLGIAGKKSYDRGSFRPLAAESVRQTGAWSGAAVGGWVGVWAGAESGAAAGALFGIELGPWAVVTGAIGAAAFGAVGYWRGDVIAGWIDPPEEVKIELRKDVNHIESKRNTAVTLIVGISESQYEFCRRALAAAAVNAQKETYRAFDHNLPSRFADKFYPPVSKSIEQLKMMNWQNDNSEITKLTDLNKDGKINTDEWEAARGKIFTYHLGDKEVDVLVNMLFGLQR